MNREQQQQIQLVREHLKVPEEEFKKVCEAQLAKLKKTPVPKILYHYTQAKAFQSIVCSGEVWATDIRYMNDASEIIYSRRLIEETIKALGTNAVDADEREFLGRISRTFDAREMFPIFAFCMSERADELSQWIAYGGRRGGFALGLSTSISSSVLVGEEVIPSLRDAVVNVVYDEAQQQEAIKAVLEKAVSIYRKIREKLSQPLQTHLKARICHFISRGIFPLLLQFKHPAFCHEREWRLTHPLDRHDKSIQYHTNTMGLVPHIRMKIESRSLWMGRMPIKEVFQGPTAEPELALQALKDFLSVRDYPWPLTQATASTIPLRF